MLTDKELLNISGGSIKWTLALVAGTIITFIAGVIDGYLRPLKCN